MLKHGCCVRPLCSRLHMSKIAATGLSPVRHRCRYLQHPANGLWLLLLPRRSRRRIAAAASVNTAVHCAFAGTDCSAGAARLFSSAFCRRLLAGQKALRLDVTAAGWRHTCPWPLLRWRLVCKPWILLRSPARR